MLQVVLAEKRPEKEVVAVKVLRKEVILQEDDLECALSELRVLALHDTHSRPTRSPFLVQLHSSFHTIVRPAASPRVASRPPSLSLPLHTL